MAICSPVQRFSPMLILRGCAGNPQPHVAARVALIHSRQLALPWLELPEIDSFAGRRSLMMRPFGHLEALQVAGLNVLKRVLCSTRHRRDVCSYGYTRLNVQDCAPATGAAAGRARRRRAPRRTTNSSPGNSRGRAAAFLQSTRSPRPCRTTGPRTPLPGETSAARCGEKS